MRFEDWLERKLDAAHEEARASTKIAMNSYGAGYDRGYYDALQSIFSVLPKAIADAHIGDECS